MAVRDLVAVRWSIEGYFICSWDSGDSLNIGSSGSWMELQLDRSQLQFSMLNDTVSTPDVSNHARGKIGKDSIGATGSNNESFFNPLIYFKSTVGGQVRVRTVRGNPSVPARIVLFNSGNWNNESVWTVTPTWAAGWDTLFQNTFGTFVQAADIRPSFGFGNPAIRFFLSTAYPGYFYAAFRATGNRRVTSINLNNIILRVNGLTGNFSNPEFEEIDSSQNNLVRLYFLAENFLNFDNSDTLEISWSEGSLKYAAYGDTDGSGGTIFNSLAAIRLPIENLVPIESPAFEGASISPGISGAGADDLFIFWSTDIKFRSPESLADPVITSSYGITRTITQRVISSFRLILVLDKPLYAGEVLTVSDSLGAVQHVDALNGTQGLSLPYTNQTVAVGSGPLPTVTKPVITQIRVYDISEIQFFEITFDIPVQNPTKNITLTSSSYTGNEILQSSGFQAQDPNDRVWRYNLTRTISQGASVNAVVPSAFVLSQDLNQPNDSYNGEVDNQITTDFQPPQILGLPYIDTDGLTLVIIFNKSVVLKPQTEASLTVFAEDADSSSSDRTYQIEPDSAVLSTTKATDDTLTVTLASTIPIRGEDLPSAGDGDIVTLDALAGYVDSKESFDAGSPIGALPLFDQEVDNNSLVPEPAPAAVPDFVSAEINISGNELRIVWDTDVASPGGSPKPTLIGSISGTATFAAAVTIESNTTSVYSIISAAILQGESLTVSGVSGVVQAQGDGTLSNPFTSEPVTNNSEVIPQPTFDLDAELQDIIVSVDGLRVGLYFSGDISASATAVTITSTLTGTRIRTLEDEANASLVLSELVDQQVPANNLPIFQGERVFVSGPQGLVINLNTVEFSPAFSDIEAKNHSNLKQPLPPELESASINSDGDTLTLTYFDCVSIPSEMMGYLEGNRSGRNNFKASSASDNVVICDIAGLTFINEQVKIYLPAGFVRDHKYMFFESNPVNDFLAANGSTVVEPTLAETLNP